MTPMAKAKAKVARKLSNAKTKAPKPKTKTQTGKAKAIRFSTLEAICEHLDCQPGEILEYRPETSKRKKVLATD